MKRGYRERPLLDEDLEPTSRAEMISADQLGRKWGWIPLRREEVPIDPALVEQVAAMQRRAS